MREDIVKVYILGGLFCSFLNSLPESHLPGELPYGCILSANNLTAVVIVVVAVVDSAAAPHPTVALPHNSVGGRGQACLSQRQDAES